MEEIRINGITNKYITEIRSPNGLNRLQGIMQRAFDDFKGLADKVREERTESIMKGGKDRVENNRIATENLNIIQCAAQKVLSEAIETLSKTSDPSMFETLLEAWRRRLYGEILGRSGGDIIIYHETAAEKRAAKALYEASQKSLPIVPLKEILPRIENLLFQNPKSPLDSFLYYLEGYKKGEKTKNELFDSVRNSASKLEGLYRESADLEKLLNGQPGSGAEYRRIREYVSWVSDSANNLATTILREVRLEPSELVREISVLQLIAQEYSPIYRVDVK